MPRLINVLIPIISLMTLNVCSLSCSSNNESQAKKTTQGKVIFEDKFDREAIGSKWLDTSDGKYTIVNGQLRVQGARNKPLWLTPKLPRNTKATFTARSASPAVDIKVELFGDGKSFAKTVSYTASSYVFILGGWNNSRSIIARMNEHGKDRKSRRNPKAQKDKTYKFAISRIGNKVIWELDGELFLEMDDPSPLEGDGHEYFAVNNWESEVFIDDLVIYEL